MSFSLKIQGTTFRNFSNFKLSLQYNSIASVFSFDVVMDPDNPDHRKLFQPFTYRKVEVFADEVLMLTGVILNHEFAETTVPEPLSAAKRW